MLYKSHSKYRWPHITKESNGMESIVDRRTGSTQTHLDKRNKESNDQERIAGSRIVIHTNGGKITKYELRAQEDVLSTASTACSYY